MECNSETIVGSNNKGFPQTQTEWMMQPAKPAEAEKKRSRAKEPRSRLKVRVTVLRHCWQHFVVETNTPYHLLFKKTT